MTYAAPQVDYSVNPSIEDQAWFLLGSWCLLQCFWHLEQLLFLAPLYGVWLTETAASRDPSNGSAVCRSASNVGNSHT